ncbi:MAG TPA: SDR family oxidoreductase [Kofleriaceae bacterium]|nr:SDR family oxidoreductase [Kofleriaceae bacterium]
MPDSSATSAASATPATPAIAIVTGGNGGIGLELVRGLARAGRRVILAGRDARACEEAAAVVRREVRDEARVVAWPLDLASLASVRAFAARARAELPRLDILVCNAGVWPGARRTTADGFELAFGVNHLGHFLLVRELEPLLRASAPARIVVLSSGLHVRGRMAWDDLQHARGRYRGTDAYAASKLANLLFTFALARRLAGTGVTANAAHPGLVKTRLGRELPELLMKLSGPLLRTPARGAETPLFLALSPEVATVTGRYFDDRKPRKPSPVALDRASQERLWSISEQLVRAPREPRR